MAVCMIAVTLPDSILAFHKHGMQGRSFKGNEVKLHVFYFTDDDPGMLIA